MSYKTNTKTAYNKMYQYRAKTAQSRKMNNYKLYTVRLCADTPCVLPFENDANFVDIFKSDMNIYPSERFIETFHKTLNSTGRLLEGNILIPGTIYQPQN